MCSKHTMRVLLFLIINLVFFYLQISADGTAPDTSTSSEVKSNECEEKNSADEFPKDIFSQQQRIHGAFLIHVFILIYCFLLISFVCQDYFLPAVFCICSGLRITPDIAAATFMASATSVPEMCVNIIATFVTKSDLGLGTIVGSSVCNTLGVAGIAGLAVRKSIKLEMWPLLRDSFIHICVLAVLALILLDGDVVWIEAFILVVLYFIYFFVMLTQKHIHSFICKLTNFTSFLFPNNRKNVYNVEQMKVYTVCEKIQAVKSPSPAAKISTVNDKKQCEQEFAKETKFHQIWKKFTYPADKILSLTIPNCKSNEKFYPFTFLMSAVWIGINSYVACWMIAILGDTIHAPDIVMGMLFLSIGGSIPEASSAFINARNNIGSMSISNTLGANTLDILLSLGMPWLIKTSLPEAYGGGPILFSTNDFVFNCMGLASSVIILNIISAANCYHMNRIFGFSCLFCYFGIIFLFIIVSLGIVKIFSVTNTLC